MKRRPNRIPDNIDIEKSYLEIDGLGWRSPIHLSIHSIMDLMELELPPAPNVKIVTFEDQDSSITRPPDTYSIDTSLHLSVDENFLYVWINNRWKRLPLSNF